MHPDFLRELNAQRGREMRDRAHRARLVRMSRRSRHVRDLPPDDEIVVPAIPDYVDGSFRAAGDEAADRVPAARHAA